MLSPTISKLPPLPNQIKKLLLILTLNPALNKHFCYALCRAYTVLLTTRMPGLRMCVGKCGTGIGVVFGGDNQEPATIVS
jgi:hypothetical protein